MFSRSLRGEKFSRRLLRREYDAQRERSENIEKNKKCLKLRYLK